MAERERRTVDGSTALVPYYPDPDTALQWYQDPELCRQVDNTDRVYDLEMLERMYSFLDAHGDLYYIEYKGQLVGDAALRDSGEVCIVICRQYQNRHIGRKVIAELIGLAREKGFSEVKAQIYSFNEQSRAMFRAAGFEQTAEEWFTYRIKEKEEEDD